MIVRGNEHEHGEHSRNLFRADFVLALFNFYAVTKVIKLWDKTVLK